MLVWNNSVILGWQDTNVSNILPVTAVRLTPLLLTFSNTEKRVNVYLVPAVRDETVWVTGPPPTGALMFISVPLNWRMKLTLLLTSFHCRVILVSSCPADLKLSVFGGAETENQSSDQFYWDRAFMYTLTPFICCSFFTNMAERGKSIVQ